MTARAALAVIVTREVKYLRRSRAGEVPDAEVVLYKIGYQE
jgi:hypothetical protein